MIFPSHGSTSRRLTCETNSSSTTLHMDTCSWKLTGEANSTTPHVDILWLTGKVMKPTLTGHKTSEVDWGGHDPSPNHVNESLLSEVDWGEHNPDADDPEQLTGESIQSFLTFVVQLQWLVALGRLVTHAQITTLSKLMVASS